MLLFMATWLAAAPAANVSAAEPHDHTTGWGALPTDAPLSNGFYYVDGDTVTATDNIKIRQGQSVTICLNGKTLDMGAYIIENNGSLTVCDCSAGQTGKITGTAAANYTGIIKNNQDVILTFESGTVEYHSAYVAASCIYNDGGEVFFNGGNLKLNTSAMNACIYNINSGKVYVYGGNMLLTPTDVNHSNDPGAIINESGTVEMHGGAITSGVHGIRNFSNSNNKVTLSGGTVSAYSIGIANYKDSHVIINRDAYIKSENTGCQGVGILNEGNAEIKSGTVEADVPIINEETGTLEMISGTVNGITEPTWIYNRGNFTLWGGTVNAKIENNNTLAVRGGTVSTTQGYAIVNSVNTQIANQTVNLYLSNRPTISTEEANTEEILISGGSVYATADNGSAPYIGNALSLKFLNASNEQIAIHNITEDNKEKFTVSELQGYTLVQSGDDIYWHQHVFASDDWTADDTGHWHECTTAPVCDITDNTQKGSYAPHNALDDGVCECGTVAINEAAFPDADFRAYLETLEGADGGVFTPEELAAVTEITVPARTIESLQGIEHFTELTKLDCSGNQLTALDIGKNIKLQALHCTDNALTKLDVSRNAELQRLECGSNDLTELDVSQNTKLIYLYCKKNLLTSLDVSQNEKLISLDCSNNKLTSLVVGKKTAVEVFCFQDNHLMNIDLSQVTFDPIGGLVNSTQTSKIGLKPVENTYKMPAGFAADKMKNLTGGTVTGDATSGYTLTVNEGLTAVTYNYVMGYNLELGDDAPTMAVTLSVHTHSESGYCSEEGCGALLVNDKNFTDANFLAYVQTLAGAEDGVFTPEELAAVTEISVPARTIESLQGIEYFTKLEKLDCSNNKLTALDVSKNTELKSLNCSKNQITEPDISNNKKLTLLHCENNKLTALDVSQNTELEELRCAYNELTSLDIRKNAKLRTLLCGNNRLLTVDISENPNLVFGFFFGTQTVDVYIYDDASLLIPAEVDADRISAPVGATLEGNRFVGIFGDKVVYSYSFDGGSGTVTLNIQNPHTTHRYSATTHLCACGEALHRFDANGCCSCGLTWMEPTQIPASPFAGGTGTESDPYIIKNAQQLANLAYLVNHGTNDYATKYYKLADDIDLGGNSQWIPIGCDGAVAFQGHFDGAGYTVRGLLIGSAEAPYTSYAGLFGAVKGGSVKNLTVQGEVYGGSAGTKGTAGIVGYAEDALIGNCTNMANVTAKVDCGGIVGYATGTQIVSCRNVGMITSAYRAGGIAGVMQAGRALNCHNIGAVSGTQHAGGITAYLGYGSIENCYNTGSVSGDINGIGGIAGMASSHSERNPKYLIKNCYNIGTVSGNGNLGEILGYAEPINVTNLQSDDTSSHGSIENCYYIKDKSILGEGELPIANCHSFEGPDSSIVDQRGQELSLVMALNASVRGTSGDHAFWEVDATANGGYPTFAASNCTSHSFAYSRTNDGAIVEECYTCGYSASVSLGAPDNTVYDGTEKLVTAVYSNNWQGPKPAVLQGSNVNAGEVTALLVVGAMGTSLTYTITPKPVNALIADIGSVGYTGNAHTPAIRVFDPETGVELPASEYTVAYSNNTAPGTAGVVIIDAVGGNYEVSGATSFIIEDAVQFRAGTTHIEWKYVSEADTEWKQIISIESLIGEKGEQGERGEAGTDGKDGKDGTDGIDGTSPHIGENGNWWIGSEDTGVKAAGKDGADGTNGQDGEDGINGTNGTDGADGIDGADGREIEIQVSDDGKTLLWRYENGTWATLFDLSTLNGADGAAGKDGQNGQDGKDGIDGKDGANGQDGKDGIDGKDGQNGQDGKNGTNGKDGVNGTDGADGLTPRIGENGNWWIGDADTEVQAIGEDGIDGVTVTAITVGSLALAGNLGWGVYFIGKKKNWFQNLKIFKSES